MNALWRLDGVDLAALDRMASAVAVMVGRGDTIALQGDLGSGKTTFARFLIAHLMGGGQQDMPSPTFALVQTYETPRLPVTHVDAYRLANPSEAEELGLEEALAQGLLLVEWPERIGEHLPRNRLDVTLKDVEGDEGLRRVVLAAHGDWQPRLERLRAALQFLAAAGWGASTLRYVQGDASTRRYVRLVREAQSAMLMDAPRRPDGPPIRDGKPYSALAHLAEDVRPFVAMAGALRRLGLSAPEVLACDLDQGFLLLEDLGDRVFTREVAQGASLAELYRPAVDVLLALREAPCPDALPVEGEDVHRLPPYDMQALTIEVELLLDWYWPALHGAAAPQHARAEFLALWRDALAPLLQAPPGWVLRDYHSPNLMWLPERTGVARVGILDMQDALRGPPAYDLVSLLQDARLDVPAALERDLLEQYCACCEGRDSTFNRADFLAAYAILGAQRNTKILGIFARLAKRDGKRAYLAHMPRVAAYLERDLSHSALAPLAAWYERHLPRAARRRPLAL